MNISSEVLHKNVESIDDIVSVCHKYINENPRIFLKSSIIELTSGFSNGCSWRGSYDEPALLMGDEHDMVKFLAELDELTSKEYEGYHGGEFYFSDSDGLHIETCESTTYGAMISHAIYNAEDGTLTFIADKEW